MKLTLNIGFEELFNLADQLPLKEKQRLISLLQKTIKPNNQFKLSGGEERQLGKYEKEIQMAEDFNEPMDDFNEYMQ